MGTLRNLFLPSISRRRAIRYLAVVDGEHYPPVVESALNEIAAGGDEVVAALLVGGREKLPAEGVEAYGDVQVVLGDDPRAALDDFLSENEVDAVVDLSDEPVLDYRRRHVLASIALWRDTRYLGADFEFRPPPRPRLATKPSIAIVGTGKRTGKTAVAGFTARVLTERGHRPVIVAMGRGGPPEPEVLRGDEVSLEPADLLAMADAGKHAASDYVEDALLGRVPTVGCRRCGGGLAGGVEISNVAAGIEVAGELPGDLLLLEGSGSSIPPCRADATILVVPASIPGEYLTGYMGPYRLLLADFVVVTMCEEPFGSPSQVSRTTSLIRDSWSPETKHEIELVRTVFRPTPTRSVQGAEVVVATTAPEAAGEPIKRHLEGEHGCRVVGISHSLSDRTKLKQELKDAGRADVLLCEIKAAGIDVATREALRSGMDVVYMDNVPLPVDGGNLEAMLGEAADLAAGRHPEGEREAT
ncbi:MAG TPA: 2,3-diphosphoglycerate synthetase [Actinomycetota bacterium]|nr:2,3-diphosphoglycerate synthetase [Actinomycetota bacterium]